MSEVTTEPAPQPLVPSEPGLARRVLNGLLAVITSSAAVKEEKNLAAMIIGGTLLSVGASVGLVDAVTQVIQAL